MAQLQAAVRVPDRTFAVEHRRNGRSSRWSPTVCKVSGRSMAFPRVALPGVINGRSPSETRDSLQGGVFTAVQLAPPTRKHISSVYAAAVQLVVGQASAEKSGDASTPLGAPCGASTYTPHPPLLPGPCACARTRLRGGGRGGHKYQ